MPEPTEMEKHKHNWKDYSCTGCQRNPGVVAYCLICNAERHGEDSANYKMAAQGAEMLGKEITAPIIITVNAPTLAERIEQGH